MITRALVCSLELSSCLRRGLRGAAYAWEEAGAGMSTSWFYSTAKGETMPVALRGSLTRFVWWKAVRRKTRRQRKELLGSCIHAAVKLSTPLAGMASRHLELPSYFQLFPVKYVQAVLGCLTKTHHKTPTTGAVLGYVLRGGELLKINLGVGVAECSIICPRLSVSFLLLSFPNKSPVPWTGV